VDQRTAGTWAWGDVGAFSFYPTKSMTTGEGGMLVTGSPGLAERIEVLRLHGSGSRFWAASVLSLADYVMGTGPRGGQPLAEGANEARRSG